MLMEMLLKPTLSFKFCLYASSGPGTSSLHLMWSSLPYLMPFSQVRRAVLSENRIPDRAAGELLARYNLQV